MSKNMKRASNRNNIMIEISNSLKYQSVQLSNFQYFVTRQRTGILFHVFKLIFALNSTIRADLFHFDIWTCCHFIGKQLSIV
jgi:hypothetical protein